MSTDDEKGAPGKPSATTEPEVPMTPVIGEDAGEELPPLPDEMEEEAAPVGGKASGDELPPLPPGMTDNTVAGRPTPVSRPQPAVGTGVPQGAPGSQAQKPKGKGAMMVLIFALIACALYQGAQAWQAAQTEAEAKEKAQQNAAAEAKVIQQAKDTQAHVDRIVGLVKPKHEAESALEDIQARRREFMRESGNVDIQRSRRRAEAERALREAKEKKTELEKQLKEGKS